MLQVGPLHMLYLEGSQLARSKKEITRRDFRKRWAVKKAVCKKGESPTGFDMEDEYEIIGEFDRWSQAMKCRNEAFEALPKSTFCAIDDPETTHWTISGYSSRRRVRDSKGDSLRRRVPRGIPRGAEFVKLWCVINQDEIDERRDRVGLLERERFAMKSELESMIKKCFKETDEAKKQMKKQMKIIKALKVQYQSKRLEVEKMRWLVSGDIPQEERMDCQPGYEVAYTYHADNTFVPTGVMFAPGGGYQQAILNLSREMSLPMSVAQMKKHIENDDDLVDLS